MQFYNQLLLTAYYYGTLPCRGWANARAARSGQAPILMLFYHRIADEQANAWTMTNARFTRQIGWLAKRFDLVSLQEAQQRIRRGWNNRPALSITFDDGYAENCLHALPLLVKQRILPWTLMYCVWFSMFLIAQNYLWCAEKARLAGLVYFVGLLVNVALNLWLLPILGLLGAVLATAAANATALGLVYLLSQQLSMTQDRAVWLVSALPLALGLGPLAAAAVLLIACWAAVRSRWLLHDHEKRLLVEVANQYLVRISTWRGRRQNYV